MRIKALAIVGLLALSGGLAVAGYHSLHSPPRSVWGKAAHKDGEIDPQTGCYWGSGTRRMAQRLEDRIPLTNIWLCASLNQERVRQLQASLAADTGPRFRYKRVSDTTKLGDELLNAGDTEEAIRTYHAAEQLIRKEMPSGLQPEMLYMLLKQQAMAYLRLGEQQNCCANNNADSCLLPIRGQGLHTKQYGAREGIKRLTQALRLWPQDMAARWSLNIAYMALGEYPNQVPPRWLIPPRVFQSAYDIKRFRNVAPEMGLDLSGLAGGCVMEDFDGDGSLDLMICRSGLRDQLRLFHNNGDGTFTERTREAGLTGETGGFNLIQADYNNDGHPDLFVLRRDGLPCSLLRNNGDGTFDDVTEQAGLLSYRSAATATWLDYNGDGYLDLFVGYEVPFGDKQVPSCALYRNNGDGTFTDVSKECGLDRLGSIKSVVSLDFNNDGRPDLFLTCSGEPNRLLRNDGPRGWFGSPKSAWKFTDVAASTHVAGPFGSAACCAFDYDNDGWPDLFITGNYYHGAEDVARDYLGLPGQGDHARLYRNNHDGSFTDVTRAAHLDKEFMGQAVNYGDLDNDGWLDLYVGTGGPALNDLVPKRMFRNAEGRSFQDVTTSGDFGHLQKGDAICFGDLFNDGNQDIYEVMGGVYSGDVAHNVLYRNPGNNNHWVTLTLEGVQSNRSAIGARIKVTVVTTTGTRALYRTVGAGDSYGASPLRQEIGLGQAEAIRSVEIFWPRTGKTQLITGLSLDHRYRILEGLGTKDS